MQLIPASVLCVGGYDPQCHHAQEPGAPQQSGKNIQSQLAAGQRTEGVGSVYMINGLHCTIVFNPLVNADCETETSALCLRVNLKCGKGSHVACFQKKKVN